jgi:hypothetical protein
MGIQVCVKLLVAAAAILFGWSAAHAVPLEQWTNRAMDFVAKFEGSDFGAITADVDCQGLSLGKKQHTIKGNSIKNVFEEVIALVGRPGLDQIIGETLGDKATEFNLLVDESLNNSAARMARVRSWQEIKQGARWVDLTEGECATGAKRGISPTSLRLKVPYGERIAAFLQHATITQAQRTLIGRGGKMALERAACWALAARREPRPSFQEYLFFFDYLIQNGDSFTERSALQTVILTMQFDKESVASKDDALVRQKMIQLKEWLEAGFKNMRNPGAARDHADYAKENAGRWMARFNEGAVTKDQVRLAYVGLMRAMLGNNQWAYAAMNRRGTIAFGNGVVNGQDYSAQSMRELMDGAGEIDQSAVSSVQCRG